MKAFFVSYTIIEKVDIDEGKFEVLFQERKKSLAMKKVDLARAKKRSGSKSTYLAHDMSIRPESTFFPFLVESKKVGSDGCTIPGRLAASTEC